MKRGILCRFDCCGLGYETWDFWRNIHFDKGLGIKIDRLPQDLKRFGDIPIFDFGRLAIAMSDSKDKMWTEFLEGLDVVFTIESPYHSRLFSLAREYGVKSVVKVNHEWWQYDRPSMPDKVVYPEKWYTPKDVEVLTCPVYRKEIPFQLREKALRFVHFAGFNAGHDREGTTLVKQANKFLTKTQIKIYDQYTAPFATRDEMYKTGDVLIHPRRYGGQSLKLNEALSSGMVVLMTNMKPQNKILPEDWLVPINRVSQVRITNPVEYCTFDPRVLAEMVDSLYGQNISEQSKIADQIAETRSWDTLRSRWEEILS